MSYNPARFPSFDVVAYHANCTDGLAAAAVVRNFFTPLLCGESMPKFVPVQYGQDLPEEIKLGGQRILFVDWCPELEQISGIQAAWKDWFVIDHHQSREWIHKEYPNNSFFVNGKCGAVLTFEWFRPGYAIPSMLSFIQDRDLWTWQLPQSRAVSAALGEEERSVERFSDLVNALVSPFVVKGEVLLASRTRAAQSLAGKSFLTQTLSGVPFRAVNATENVSEVGEEILRAFADVDVACGFFQVGADVMQLSLRSRAHAPGSATALSVARELGGGGHEHAAGARMALEDWPHFLRGQVAVRI